MQAPSNVCALLQAATHGPDSPGFAAALDQHRLAIAKLREHLVQWPSVAMGQAA